MNTERFLPEPVAFILQCGHTLLPFHLEPLLAGFLLEYLHLLLDLVHPGFERGEKVYGPLAAYLSRGAG